MRYSSSRGNLRPTPVAEAFPKPSGLFRRQRANSPRGPNLAKFRRIAKGFIKLFKIHFAAKRRKAAPSSERTGLGHVRSVIRARLRLPVSGADNRPARAKSGTVFPGSAPIAERTEPSALRSISRPQKRQPEIPRLSTADDDYPPPTMRAFQTPNDRKLRRPAPSSGLAVRI